MKKYLKIALSTLALSATATGITILSLTSCGKPDIKVKNTVIFGPNNEYVFYNKNDGYNFNLMPTPKEGEKVYFHLDKDDGHMATPGYFITATGPRAQCVSVSLDDPGVDGYQCCLTYTSYFKDLKGKSIELVITVSPASPITENVTLFF